MNEPQSILIVDDSRFNREFFCRLVNSLGYVSRTADNGKSALAAIRSTPPDLVLLDILMPQMDGHEVLSHMRRENLLHHIPVVVVSAVDDQSSIARCIEAGADDYLIKPFNQVLLRSRITGSLEKKRLRDQEEEIRRQIKAYNRQLEQQVQEQVEQITAAELKRAKLSRYLSPNVVDEILKSEKELVLGGDRKRVTVLFSDIRGYSRVSREMRVDAVVQMLNDHFTAMARIIFDCGVTLDKFIGDSVMAVFGSPFSSGEDARNAILAAWQMQLVVTQRLAKADAIPEGGLQIGIGINTGDVIAGNIGCPQQMDFTVIGDTVNLSSRLTEIAKPGDIIVGESTVDHVRNDFQFENIGKHQFKNFVDPVRCFRLVAL
jgi:class 3 adenylate cyclase/CheY-like chemotaxis protein